MYPANSNGTPTPLSGLDALVSKGDTSEKPVKVFIGHNLGFRTFTMIVPMYEFYQLSAVANEPARDGDQIAQRKLDPLHAQKLANYVLKGLVSSAISKRQIDNKSVPEIFLKIQADIGKQPYMSLQPLVVNIRDCNPAGGDINGVAMKYNDEIASFKVYLSQRHVLWVVDGQHRRQGMEMVFKFLKDVIDNKAYPKKGSLYKGHDFSSGELDLWQECFSVARTFCTVSLEVHLGLNIDQERQLFHDLNRLGKKVDTSLALQFDNSNPVNLYIKENLIEKLGMNVEEKDQTDWVNDTGAISRKDLVAVNARLFLNKSNISGAKSNDVTEKTEVTDRFWDAILTIPGFGLEHSKLKTTAAQPVVLKALAKIVYDLAFSNRKPENSEELIEKFYDELGEIDFSHSNPVWRYYTMTQEQREESNIEGLAEYLPKDDTSVNRDIGSYQGEHMRFGSKHNDIYPLISDMIRWMMGLPSRNK